MKLTCKRESEIALFFRGMSVLNSKLSFINIRSDASALYISEAFTLNDVMLVLDKYYNLLSEEDSAGMFETYTFLCGYFKGLYKDAIYN